MSPPFVPAKLILACVYLQIGFVLSLKCYANECEDHTVGPWADDKGPWCTVNGHGRIEECGEVNGAESACYEEPYIGLEESNQLGFSGCVLPPARSRKKDAGCGVEHGKRVGVDKYVCLCFEDLCNTKYNNSLPFECKAAEGYPNNMDCSESSIM